jgi:hypothetical protein
MILNAQPPYPVSRSFVLKLHRDADPQRGRLIGRLENVATGEQYEFESGAELLACLVRDGRAQGRSLQIIEEP